MDRRSVVVALAVVLMVIFVLSLPGLGLETRKTTDYAAWAGPIFLVLTLLVFAFGVATFVLRKRSVRSLRSVAGSQAVVAILLNLLDFSGVGGPRPPLGPLVLGVSAVAVAVLELGVMFSLRSQESSPPVAA